MHPRSILAIEQDTERGARLKWVLRDRVDAEVLVVNSAASAIALLSSQVVDLLLLSALIPPADETRLLAYLKARGDAIDVLMVPPFTTPEPASTPGRFITFSPRPAAAMPQAYDADKIALRIREALERSQSGHRLARVRSETGTREQGVQSAGATRMSLVARRSTEPVIATLLKPSQMSRVVRSRRWQPADLAMPCRVQLSFEHDVRLVDISRSGMLIESTLKFPTGSSMEFRLWGLAEAPIVRPGRIVRSEVAGIDGQGAKYRTATAFEKKVYIIPEERGRSNRAVSAPTPDALAKLLMRTITTLGSDDGRDVARRTFEEGVRQLVSAREVRIRPIPQAPSDGGDSIYFTVPGAGGSPPVLQAVFEPDFEPTEEEFRLLKAAAAAAGVLLFAEWRPSDALIRIA